MLIQKFKNKNKIIVLNVLSNVVLKVDWLLAFFWNVGSTYGASYGASYTEGGTLVKPTDQETSATAAGRPKKAIEAV